MTALACSNSNERRSNVRLCRDSNPQKCYYIFGVLYAPILCLVELTTTPFCVQNIFERDRQNEDLVAGYFALDRLLKQKKHGDTSLTGNKWPKYSEMSGYKSR
jgi:hypothetical protein